MSRPDDKITEHIRSLVDEWPPLTPAQVDRLRVLLQPSPAPKRGHALTR